MTICLLRGRSYKEERFQAELSISGSINKLVIAGSVRLANTKLAGFDLGSKLSALSPFSGKTAAQSRHVDSECKLERASGAGGHKGGCNQCDRPGDWRYHWRWHHQPERSTRFSGIILTSDGFFQHGPLVPSVSVATLASFTLASSSTF
jgi:hypothetical protein